jgi:hypothetical protein
VKQTNSRIVYRPDLGISPEQARDAPARAWKFVFTCALRKQAEPLGPVRSHRFGAAGLSDGEVITAEAEDRNEKLSGVFAREVRLVSGDAFFELGAVHLLTISSLKKLGEFYPAGRFDACRFRPNIVLDLDSGETGFVEVAGWYGYSRSGKKYACA